ncbi:MAG: hypothetical protein QM733_13875 [Ilumatobacteraceae bacterium]
MGAFAMVSRGGTTGIALARDLTAEVVEPLLMREFPELPRRDRRAGVWL